MVQPLRKTGYWFLKKLNLELSFDPGIPLLSIHPNELKAETQTDTWMISLIAAIFTIVKRWKQPKNPPTDEQINKTGYVYTMECYAAIKGMTFWYIPQYRWTRGHYGVWNKPDRIGQILYDSTYVSVPRISKSTEKERWEVSRRVIA